MKRSFQANLDALLLSTLLVRQTCRGRGKNAVKTVYLSRDWKKHSIFRIESLPASAERLPGKSLSGLDSA
jgi:hypothetical protein